MGLSNASFFVHVQRIICRMAYGPLLFLSLCTLTHLISAPPAVAQDFNPLCHSEAGGNIRNVSNCSLLASALNNAAPGDIIVLANGSYNCDILSSRHGTLARPIIIRAANARMATFVDASVTVAGNYTVIANLGFNNSGMKVTGDFNRITGNKFYNNAGIFRAAVTVERGNRNRIDHNEVVDYNRPHRGFRILPAGSGNNTAKNNVIDRNYLHRSLGERINGADGIQLGANPSHTYEQLYSIVEYNLIEQWEIDGEMMSNKSSNNIIRFNTLANTDGQGPMRHGSRVQVISNYFFNVRGLINRGDDNEIIGNIVENGDLVLTNGDISQNQLPSIPGGHPASLRTLVVGNKVINGQICVGCRVPGGNAASGVPATFSELRGNVGTVTLMQHQNTTQASSHNKLIAPAVRLFPQDVGPGSPDVCNTGSTLPPSPSFLRIQQ
jgi:Chondroitinase B